MSGTISLRWSHMRITTTMVSEHRHIHRDALCVLCVCVNLFAHSTILLTFIYVHIFLDASNAAETQSEKGPDQVKKRETHRTCR
jgi:hypothetical protein